MKNLIYLFVITLFFSFCKNKKNNTSTTPPTTVKVPTVTALDFVLDSLDLKSKLCENPNDEKCAEVKINYFLATEGEEEVRNKINNKIQTILSGMFFEETADDSPGKDYVRAAMTFISDYETYVADEKNYIARHSNLTDSKILHESPELICMSFSNWSYAGGMHGNYSTRLVNFDKKTGEEITADKILKDKNQLSPLLEKKVRKHYKIEDNSSLKDFGLYYEGEQFPVNDNVGILKDSIVFEYNPYEVGPYVLGGMTLTIAKSDIKELLKPLNVQH